MAVDVPSTISPQRTWRILLGPSPWSDGREIQILVVDCFKASSTRASASSTVSLPVIGTVTTLSPRPACRVIT